MQLGLWAGFEDPAFPPAVRVDGEDVYNLLRANLFDAARDAVRTWRTDNPIRELVNAALYQDAICELGRVLWPVSGTLHGWGGRWHDYERNLAAAAAG